MASKRLFIPVPDRLTAGGLAASIVCMAPVAYVLGTGIDGNLAGPWALHRYELVRRPDMQFAAAWYVLAVVVILPAYLFGGFAVGVSVGPRGNRLHQWLCWPRPALSGAGERQAFGRAVEPRRWPLALFALAMVGCLGVLLSLVCNPLYQVHNSEDLCPVWQAHDYVGMLVAPFLFAVALRGWRASRPALVALGLGLPMLLCAGLDLRFYAVPPTIVHLALLAMIWRLTGEQFVYRLRHWLRCAAR